MTRSLWAVPLAALLTGCGSNNPCDVLTVAASFLGDVPCSEAGPCTGSIDVTLSYGNVAEPNMVLKMPISLGEERQVEVSHSLHRAILGEGDSFPNREINVFLFNPAEGTLTFNPKDLTEDDATLVDDSTYAACRVQDEEKLLINFDAVDATFEPITP